MGSQQSTYRLCLSDVLEWAFKIPFKRTVVEFNYLSHADKIIAYFVKYPLILFYGILYKDKLITIILCHLGYGKPTKKHSYVQIW